MTSYARWSIARAAKRCVAYLVLLPALAVLAPVTVIGNLVYMAFEILRTAR